MRYTNITPVRIKKMSVACCPSNLARTVASIGRYMYSVSEKGLYVHLYDHSSVPFTVEGKKICVTQTGRYPWDGKLQFTVSCEEPSEFRLALRIPGWCD